MNESFLGLEIGGTKLQLGSGDQNGNLLWLKRRTIIPADGAQGIRHQIIDMFHEAQSDHQINSGPLFWGVGFGGPVDAFKGSVLTSHQIDGWSGFPLADWLKAETKAESVTVRNDADTAALGEAISGAGVGCNPLCYITIGSGIGAGLILDQKIHLGAGRGAMEIGHLWLPDPDNIGKLQELELIASGWSIQRRASKSSVQDVYEAALAGDRHCVHVLRTAAESVGLALSHVVHLVAPQRIILGGGVSLLPDSIWGNVIGNALKAHTMSAFEGMTDVTSARLGETVVIAGAIHLAIQAAHARLI